ncbi:MAG: hypothetical protein ACLSFE_02475 [Christensenellales bacterium]
MSGSRSKLPIAALAALLLATAGFFTYLLREAAAKDDAAPVIVCSSSEIHVSVDASEEELLFGVTAMDAEDGDITSSVVIESISSFVEPGKSIITYAAFDSHNHVATASRTLYYTDYHSPRFRITDSLQFLSGTVINPLLYITAEDCIDGDISNKISMTLLESGDYISAIGVHPVEFRVTNSLGDVSSLQTEIVVYERSSYNAPSIVLSDYLVYTEPGERINPIDYVREIAFLRESYTVEQYGAENLVIDDSELNIARPGIYKVTIYCERGDATGSATLLVAVTDSVSAS